VRVGDYGEAESRYHQSFDIEERLGNQAGMASSYYQLGTLAAESSNLSEAVERYVAALAIRLGIDDRRTANTIAQLSKTRGLLPRGEFDTSARNVLDEDSLSTLHQRLDRYDAAENAGASGDTDPNGGDM